MQNNKTALALLSMRGELMEQRIVESILACNEIIEKYGLVLSEQQALSLAEARSAALQEHNRIEFNRGILDKLILAFCDSPYILQENFEPILQELIGLFYELKNNTWDTVSDRDVIAFLKNAFNADCAGSIELLSGEAMKFSERVHCRGKGVRFESWED